MGAVDDAERPAADDFEPAVDTDGGERLADDVLVEGGAEERLGRGERGRRR